MKKEKNTSSERKARSSSREKLRAAVTLSMFAALSYVVMVFVHLNVTSFLTLDFKDSVITLAAVFYGAYAGPLLAFLVAFLEMITVSHTGFYGFLMNFAGSACFSFLAAFFIRKSKRRRGFFIGLPSAVFGMTAVMILMNLFITPLYTGVDVQAVLSMITPILLPFNLAKAVLNAVLFVLLYPLFSAALPKAHLYTGVPAFAKMSKKEMLFFCILLAFSCGMAIALLILLH